MPFALIIIGIVLLVSSVRNTQDDLYTLVKGDFTGQNNYLYWMVSILIIGALGYVEALKPISRAFLALLIVVLFLSHGGVLTQLNAQLFHGAAYQAGTGAGSVVGNIFDNILGGSNTVASNDTGTGFGVPNSPGFDQYGIEIPLAPARPH